MGKYLDQLMQEQSQQIDLLPEQCHPHDTAWLKKELQKHSRQHWQDINAEYSRLYVESGRTAANEFLRECKA